MNELHSFCTAGIWDMLCTLVSDAQPVILESLLCNICIM